MMLTRRNGTTIKNIPRVDPGTRQPSRVDVTVTRLDGSSRVALSIGSDTTNLVRSYDIPLHQFLQLVAAVVTLDDLARAGIAPEQPAALPCPPPPGPPSQAETLPHLSGVITTAQTGVSVC